MPERIQVLPPLPNRPDHGHKGMFGRVLVVGGNAEMIGAPAFAGAAAFRTGAGLVQIATPKAILPFCLQVEPELIGLELPASAVRWKSSIESADACVIGPGLGQSTLAKKMLGLVLKTKWPCVVDADALNLLALSKAWPKSIKASCVLTPHPGEMKRLGKLIGKPTQSQDADDRLATAIKAARATKQIVVLKGAKTVVTDGSRYFINTTGDSTLSKAGTGDVLSGICGTLLAQKVAPFDAACISVWIHGRAGEIAGAKLGKRSATATDVINAIGPALTDYVNTFGETA